MNLKKYIKINYGHGNIIFLKDNVLVAVNQDSRNRKVLSTAYIVNGRKRKAIENKIKNKKKK